MKQERTGAAEAWLLQAPPGLAAVLKKEMVYVGALERKQDLLIKRQRNHDLLFANHLKGDAGLGRLRIAEGVFRCPVFGRYKISQRQLQTLADTLKPLGPKRLIVQVAGKHFDRRDIGRWLEKELNDRGAQVSDDVEDEFWMFCIDESYYFGIPLTKARSAEGRDERTEERTGSLPPPVAAAMAFAGMPKADDVIVDPVCGSGTLLAEARAYSDGARRIGVDIDPEAVRVARANLGDSAEIMNADSTRLKLESKITLTLANLPFGKQYGKTTSNPELYQALLKRTLELADSGRWRGVFLTSDIESWRQALGAFNGLESQDLFRVKIRGELATAVKLKIKKA